MIDNRWVATSAITVALGALTACSDSDGAGGGGSGGGSAGGADGAETSSNAMVSTSGSAEAGPGATVSASGGTGSSSGDPWGCIEGNGSCDCYSPKSNGYDQPTCGGYSCCLEQTYPDGLKQCFCSNASPCEGNPSTTQVSQCPP
jgi:hypothetical protein